MLEKVRETFGPFPFARRWCGPLDPDADALVQKLFRLGIIMGYPVLTDIAHGIVAQAEHSVIVMADGCRVIT